MNKKFVITELTLEKLGDKELNELFLKTRAKLNAGKRKKYEARYIKNLELDMCFIQREIDLRNRTHNRI